MLAIIGYLGLAFGVLVAGAFSLMVLLGGSAQLGSEIAATNRTQPPSRAPEISAAGKTTGQGMAEAKAATELRASIKPQKRVKAAAKRKPRASKPKRSGR
jgi:hypothetical protein